MVYRPTLSETTVASRAFPASASVTIGAVDGLIDIHAHVLPGIDDGPADLTEAIEMLRAASEAGTAAIVATPHLRRDFPDVQVAELTNRCEQLRHAIVEEGIDIRLVAGAEVSLAWALAASDEALRLATYDQRGSDLLIETPSGTVVGLNEALYDLRTKGFRVTLAHPERSPELQRAPVLLAELTRQGVLLQINADALVADARRSSTGRLARQICTQGLVHVLASDGHRASVWRPVTRLPAGVQAAAGLVGAQRARWISVDVPAAIIEGTELPEPPPIVKRWWRWKRRGG